MSENLSSMIIWMIFLRSSFLYSARFLSSTLILAVRWKVKSQLYYYDWEWIVEALRWSTGKRFCFCFCCALETGLLLPEQSVSLEESYYHDYCLTRLRMQPHTTACQPMVQWGANFSCYFAQVLDGNRADSRVAANFEDGFNYRRAQVALVD